MTGAQAAEFIISARDADWYVSQVKQVLIELPGVLNSWLVTSEYTGTSKHVQFRTVHDLVCEKDGKFYNFDVTELVSLNEQRRTKMYEELAEVEKAFVKLEMIEESYRKHFGQIPPITDR